ncbi:MAG: hypothetical protein WHS46_02795 [Desulfosoma sp.]
MWHEWGCLEERKFQWTNPWHFRWPEKPQKAEYILKILHTGLDPAWSRFLLTAFFAAALGRREEKGAHSFLQVLQRLMTPHDVGLCLDWAYVLQAQWALVALPTVQGKKAHVFWALLGALPSSTQFHSPSWIMDRLDAAAQGALVRAHELFRHRTGKAMVFIPLLPPSEPSPCIEGPSWALPAYLGAWEAHLGAMGGRRGLHVAASGDVDEQGCVLPVGFVREKAKALAALGFQTLICPLELAETQASAQGLRVEQVRNIQAAECLWELKGDVTGKGFAKDFEKLGSPQELALGLRSLDPRLRGWSGFSGLYAHAVKEILQNPRDAESFTDSLERLFSDASEDLGWVETLLNPISFEDVQDLARQSFLTSFRLAHLLWAVAGQRGNTEEALCWAKFCRDTFSQQLPLYLEGIHRLADFWNRLFVTLYHGRYHFDAKLPEWLTDIQDHLESIRESHAVKGLKPAMPSLGKIYGTIAQNFGFCGPLYLRDSIQSVSKAWNAFGEWRLQEFKKDCLRQYHYLVYAYLDANQVGKAQEALENYIESPLDKVNPARLQRYQHAALARFLAETDFRLPVYEKWCREQLYRSPAEHPWQLWLWNVGRWLHARQEKKIAWEQGLRFCTKLGSTAQPMALLHAAWLYREGLALTSWLEEGVFKVLEEVAKGRLHTPHFAELLSKTSWQEVVEAVADQPARWFPFTYR